MNPNKSTKTALVFLLGFILLAAAYFFYKKQYGNPVSGLKPRIEMGVGRISNITDSTVDVNLKALLHNPLPVGMEVKSFDYFVQMDGDTIVRNTHSEALSIKSHDSTVIELPSRISLASLKAANARASPGSDSADYEFTAVFNLYEKLLGKEALVINFDQRLPRYQLPFVEVLGYDLDKFRLNQSEVVIRLQFVNNNPFKIEFINPSYQVDLGSQKSLAQGSVPGVTQVNGKSEKDYEIPLAVNMGSMLKATGQLIGQGKSLPFKLDFRCKLGSDNEIFDGTDVNVLVEGTLEDLATVKKNVAK